MNDRTPVLVGAGQITQKDIDPAAALEPIALCAKAARAAAQDAEAGDRLLAALDTVAVVRILSWRYRNPSRLLAELVGARPRHEIHSTIGGNTPQMLVDHLAERVRRGEVEAAVIVGSECMYSATRAQRRGETPPWTLESADVVKPEVLGEDRPGSSDAETAHSLFMPTQVYPLFENALRAQRGWSLDQHRRELGALMARFAAVAARNPYAWFREEPPAEAFVSVGDRNRMIGLPYPKLMNAILDVDQAAAVILTSVGKARALGIPESRWVHLHGWGEAHDHWWMSERENFHSSPAIRAAGETALARAGARIEDIENFDLYSCFPCAVQIARQELGIAADDPRPLTVTGGLARFGGPGNAYSLHGIATMMDRLRAAPGERGLVTALGWYLTKHAIGIYGTEPHEPIEPPAALDDPQRRVDGSPGPRLEAQPNGPATIETYTVLFGRDGSPERGIVVGRLADGARFLANTPEDRALLESMTCQEMIGTKGSATAGSGANLFTPA